MVNDTTPLLSSVQATVGFDTINEETLRASSLTGIEDESQNSQDEVTERDDLVPTINPYLVVPLLLVGVFLANADTSIVIATAHKIASEFDLLPQSSWLVTSYTLAMCSVLGLYGKLSDIFGRKPVLTTAICLFAIGCLLCGSAPYFWVLLVGRAFSGLGGAGMNTLTAIITTDLVSVRNNATWRSYANVVGTLGRILGAPLGGYIFDVFGWRWSFYVQVPIAIITLGLVLLILPDLSTTSTGFKDPEATVQKSKLSRVDFAGAINLALVVCTFSLFLDTIGKGQSITSLQAWSSLLIAALGFLSFIWIEQHLSQEPLLPISLLTNKDLLLPSLAIAFQHAAQFGTNFSIPIYFEITRGATASEAGTYLLFPMFGFIIGSAISSIYISKTGKYKIWTVLVCVFGCVGFLMLILRFRGDTKVYEIMYLIPCGMAMGFVTVTMFTHVVASVPKHDTAIACGCFSLFGNLGLLLGLNFSNALLHSRFFSVADQQLEGVKGKQEIIRRAFSSISYVRNLPDTIRPLIIRAYVQSFTAVYGSSLCFAVLALTMVLLVRERCL